MSYSIIAIVISLIALVISFLAAFPTFLPFKLEMIVPEITIPAVDKTINIEGLPIILTITFVNTSYSDGIVEDLRLHIIYGDTETKRLIPFAEMNLHKFLTTKNAIFSNEYIIDRFRPFLIKGREAIKKDILFYQSYSDTHLREWQAGSYDFILYAKVRGKGMPFESKGFRYNLSKEMLDNMKYKGRSIMQFKIQQKWIEDKEKEFMKPKL
jgi:hypothetical protein